MSDHDPAAEAAQSPQEGAALPEHLRNHLLYVHPRPWRVGSKVARNVYDANGEGVTMFTHAYTAAIVVAAVNMLAAEPGRSTSDRPPASESPGPLAALLTPNDLDELERLLAAATPGKWKLWAADVMADQDGTSNVDTAKHVASTHFTDTEGHPRTNDAQLICALHRNARGLIDAARAALRESSAERGGEER
jgi:hypothetical protein